MNERFIEIKFYYYIRNLVNAFHSSVHILDYIESICLLADINPVIIKTLIRDIRFGTSRIASYKEEAVLVCVSQHMSYRAIAKLLGIGLTTVYRINNSIDEENYKGLTRHLPLKEYQEVEKFMNFVHKFNEFS